MKIHLLNLLPYYVQTNGQAESNNKTLIKLIKKKIGESPRRWHETLSEALWVHITSKHGARKVTPFELTYGQEAELPVEINIQNSRVSRQDDLSAIEYNELMVERVDETSESRFKALKEIKKEKRKVANAYNKRVKEKSFRVGDMVWKTILPLGTWNGKFGKWSPS
jgi:hypothetical protein